MDGIGGNSDKPAGISDSYMDLMRNRGPRRGYGANSPVQNQQPSRTGETNPREIFTTAGSRGGRQLEARAAARQTTDSGDTQPSQARRPRSSCVPPQPLAAAPARPGFASTQGSINLASQSAPGQTGSAPREIALSGRETGAQQTQGTSPFAEASQNITQGRMNMIPTLEETPAGRGDATGTGGAQDESSVGSYFEDLVAEHAAQSFATGDALQRPAQNAANAVPPSPAAERDTGRAENTRDDSSVGSYFEDLVAEHRALDFTAENLAAATPPALERQGRYVRPGAQAVPGPPPDTVANRDEASQLEHAIQASLAEPPRSAQNQDSDLERALQASLAEPSTPDESDLETALQASLAESRKEDEELLAALRESELDGRPALRSTASIARDIAAAEKASAGPDAEQLAIEQAIKQSLAEQTGEASGAAATWPGASAGSLDDNGDDQTVGGDDRTVDYSVRPDDDRKPPAR